MCKEKMDLKILNTRFRQFGGIRLVWEYARLGVLWGGVKTFYKCLVKKESFKRIYSTILQKIEPFLEQRYYHFMQDRKEYYKGKELERKKSQIIWFCWLQKMEHAPPIVKACLNSLRRNLPDRKIIVNDNENWKQYVELPEYIINKWEKGRIPAALFSDLLRLELLIRYGGTWIDSTVLCTGLNDNQNDNEKFLDADLFLFQYTKRGSIPVSISNWFITSCTNNEILMVLRDMLYAYWKDYDCTLNYYIFHLFFSMLSKEFPEEIAAMPYGQSMNSLALLRHWDEQFVQKKWDNLSSNVSFHKLAFRLNEEVKNKKDNYYNYILAEYGSI